MIDFLTIDEVADLMRCDHRVVRGAIRGGELQAAMIGGKWLIRRAAVEAWFDGRTAHASTPAPVQSALRARPRAQVGDSRPGSVARLRAIKGNA